MVVAFVTLLSHVAYAFDESIVVELDDALRIIQEGHQMPALAVVVIDRGELSYARGFGFSDGSGGTHVTENTWFRVASITRLFTAQAVTDKGVRFNFDNALKVQNVFRAMLGTAPDAVAYCRCLFDPGTSCAADLCHSGGGIHMKSYLRELVVSIEKETRRL